MDTGRAAYNPDFDPARAHGKPYRSILAYPILTERNNETVSLGAISIDSEIPHHFDGKTAKLEIRIVPYIALLELVLKYRRSYGVWGG
jgi:hypothetical protein